MPSPIDLTIWNGHVTESFPGSVASVHALVGPLGRAASVVLSVSQPYLFIQTGPDIKLLICVVPYVSHFHSISRKQVLTKLYS